VFEQIKNAFSGDLAQLPSESDEQLLQELGTRIDTLRSRELEKTQQRRTLEETLHEARAFANLKAPFSNLDQLSYLTLRIGRLDPQGQDAASRSLGERAVIIPLGDGNRVVAAASKKGRFAASNLSREDRALALLDSREASWKMGPTPG